MTVVCVLATRTQSTCLWFLTLSLEFSVPWQQGHSPPVADSLLCRYSSLCLNNKDTLYLSWIPHSVIKFVCVIATRNKVYLLLIPHSVVTAVCVLATRTKTTCLWLPTVSLELSVPWQPGQSLPVVDSLLCRYSSLWLSNTDTVYLLLIPYYRYSNLCLSNKEHSLPVADSPHCCYSGLCLNSKEQKSVFKSSLCRLNCLWHSNKEQKSTDCWLRSCH